MGGLRLLLTIACGHSYFADGVCSALQLRPSAACQSLMRRYGLLFRPAPGGGAVYCMDAGALAGFDESQPLLFALDSSDPYLLNYTDPGAAPAPSDHCFYCDNLGDASGLLTPAFPASALLRRPPRFIWQSGAPLDAATLTVQDALGGVVWQQVTPAAPQDMVQVDLSGLAAGRYRLLADGQPGFDFYLDAAADARAWGAIAIFIGGAAQAAALAGGCPALDADGALAPAAPVYTLTLAARATLWRYRVFSGTLDLSGWTVQGSGAQSAPIAFTAEQVPGQQPCWMFVAQQAVALAQRPGGWTFTLGKPGAAGARGRVQSAIRLPYARGDSLVLPGGFSDVYVYL
jgi:hypothetical protein